MSRWFRSYADTHRNPKVAKLSDRDFRLWHNLLCIASENDGIIPPAEDLKHMLRMRLDHCYGLLNRLIDGSLIDALEHGYAPRNWNERQYKSDTSTPRVQKHRAKCNVSGNVSVTPPDTETEAETEKKNNPPKGGYAFDGRVIKLKRRDFEAWRKAYPDIDLPASLQSRDDWLATEADDKARERWFMSTSNHLANLQQKAAAQDRAPVWDGMP